MGRGKGEWVGMEYEGRRSERIEGEREGRGKRGKGKERECDSFFFPSLSLTLFYSV